MDISDDLANLTIATSLPDELLLAVFRQLQRAGHATSQPWLRTSTLVCRQWHRVGVEFLYSQPILTGHKFASFVAAICPSINLHIRISPLSRYIRVLDLGRLVHQGSKSVTARLLGRVKENLIEFVAPQASFAINCFPALAKCRLLQKLDLSLVSDAPNLQTLFHSVRNLEKLRELRLPRSAGFGTRLDPDQVVFPQRLERLYLSGGIDANFLRGVVQLPLTLRELTLEHCPQVRSRDVQFFLNNIACRGIELVALKVSFLPRLFEGALDEPLARLFGSLIHVSVGLDYITTDLFRVLASEFSHALPLKVLELTNSGQPGDPDKLTGLDVLSAIEDGLLTSLQQVRVAKSLTWTDPDRMDETETLHDTLRELTEVRTSTETSGLPTAMAGRPVNPGVFIIQG